MGAKSFLDGLVLWLSSLSVTDIGIALTAVSCVAAAVAALAARRQVTKLKHSNFAQIFLSFSSRYNSEEMASALRALVQWRRVHKEGFAKTWRDAYMAGDAAAAEINKARRLVSRFYQDVARLYEVGVIDRVFAAALLATNGLHVYYEICAPMNELHDPELYRGYDEILRKLRRKYAGGRVRLLDPNKITPLHDSKAA
jgi:hypothetical protein